MKKTSVLTSLPRFDSIGNMKFRPTYIRHICKLYLPKFWQIVGEYVPKMATYVSFAVLYICIHILNTLNRCHWLHSRCHWLHSPYLKNEISANSGIEIQESEFMNTNSVMQSQECGLVNKNSLINIKNWSK